MTSKVNCNRSNANELRASLKHVPSALLSPVPALLFHLQIRRKWGFHIKANWTPTRHPPSPTVTSSPPWLRIDAANATRSCCLLFLCPWWSSFSRFGTVNSFSCDSCLLQLLRGRTYTNAIWMYIGSENWLFLALCCALCNLSTTEPQSSSSSKSKSKNLRAI